MVTQQISNWRQKNQDKEISQKDINQIKNEALNYLIQQQLLLNEAHKLGIQTSKVEITNTIRSLPQFQKDEKFSAALYFQTLRAYYHLEPAEYEKIVKNNIVIQRLRRFILSSIKVTEKEIEEEYLLNDKKKDKAEIKNQLIQDKRTLFYTEWLKTLYRNVKIKNYLPRIEKILKH